MSEDATKQEAPQPAEGVERPPIEKAVAQEVAPKSQEPVEQQSSEVNQLIADAKKYRKRSQSVEAELATLQKQIASDREKQMEEQQQWQQLAEERQARIQELEPIVERARSEETQMREQILSTFSDEDRETFGDLPMSKLRALASKLTNNEQRLAVASNPAVPANENLKDWTKMNKNDRQKNWTSIVNMYAKRKK
tara:strand:- start:1481 stop:2065 length:585 start_codon:yes stop_codon:yes gene_type:complete